MNLSSYYEAQAVNLDSLLKDLTENSTLLFGSEAEGFPFNPITPALELLVGEKNDNKLLKELIVDLLHETMRNVDFDACRKWSLRNRKYLSAVTPFTDIDFSFYGERADCIHVEAAKIYLGQCLSSNSRDWLFLAVFNMLREEGTSTLTGKQLERICSTLGRVHRYWTTKCIDIKGIVTDLIDSADTASQGSSEE